METFSEIHLDAIKEIVNIGTGRATSALASMVGEEVLLSIPEVEFLTKSSAIKHMNDVAPGQLMGAWQALLGHLTGEVLLLFPKAKCLDLIRLIVKDSAAEDQLTGIEEEALLEIGNIVLNAAVGGIANTLGIEVQNSLPKLLYGNVDEVFEASEVAGLEGSQVMLLKVSFTIRSVEIIGHIMIILDRPGQDGLLSRVEQFLQNYMGGSV